MDGGKSRTGLQIQPRGATVGRRTGLFAIVAMDAQGLVDQQDVGGLADPFADEIIDDAAGFRPAFHRHVVDQAGLELGLDLAAQVRPTIEKGHERGAVDLHRFGGDGGAHRRRARRVR